MEKPKKDYKEPWRGTFLVIARKVGCTPKYASMVLRDKLGKYSDRNTEMVKKIRDTAAEIDKMFSPEA
jgi:hypothetical protein